MIEQIKEYRAVCDACGKDHNNGCYAEEERHYYSVEKCREEQIKYANWIFIGEKCFCPNCIHEGEDGLMYIYTINKTK